MKKIILSNRCHYACANDAKADEGMWLMFLSCLNHRDMQKCNFAIDCCRDLQHNHSLKDAIVQFNGGCTAEMISKDGLRPITTVDI
jgi:hypothetical protein